MNIQHLIMLNTCGMKTLLMDSLNGKGLNQNNISSYTKSI